MRHVIPALTLALGLTSCQQNTATSPENLSRVHPATWPIIESRVKKDPEIETMVSELLGKMTLAEKVGQMIQAEIQHITPEQVKTYHIGSVLSGGGSFPNNDKHAKKEDWLALADEYYQASVDTSDGHQGIPIIWGIDAVHGNNNSYGTTIFPHNIGLGATRNTALVKRIAEITAIEVNATGMDWNYAPALAVVRDDRWGRTYEGFGETPAIVSEYAGPIIEGYQGVYNQNFLDESRVIATAKVYLGDGGTHLGKDQGNNITSEKELRDMHSVGFQKALKAGTQAIMAGFNQWQGKKMHGHKSLLTDVLKTRMGFDGIVISDWNAHEQVEGCNLTRCATAINAGIDVMMVPQDWKVFIENTIEQVNTGEISINRINDAVSRILRVKARYGLIAVDGNTKPAPSLRKFAKMENVLGQASHREVARQAVRESLVLLKNNNQVLPIDSRKKILLIGDGADDIGQQCGGWTLSWQGTGNKNEDFPNGDSIYSALKKQIDIAGGNLIFNNTNELAPNIKPDIAIVAYGEDPYAEFVGDRNTLIYEDRKSKHLKLLKQLQQRNIPTVSLFISGRPMWVNPYINASEAFVAAWLPGTEAGGIADVLLTGPNGNIQYDFTGKLSFSWPQSTTQFSLNYDEKPYSPLFPYGFGLRYENTETLSPLDETIDATSQRLKQSAYIYNDGQVYLPWLLYIAGPQSSAQEVNGYLTENEAKTLSVRLVDKHRQGDSIQVNWKDDAQVYFDAFEIVPTRIDHAVMNLQARIDAHPLAEIEASISCGEDCNLKYSLDEFKQAPQGKWVEYQIPLACFKASVAMNDTLNPIQNDTLKRITFHSTEAFTMTVHSFSIETRDEKTPCP